MTARPPRLGATQWQRPVRESLRSRVERTNAAYFQVGPPARVRWLARVGLPILACTFLALHTYVGSHVSSLIPAVKPYAASIILRLACGTLSGPLACASLVCETCPAQFAISWVPASAITQAPRRREQVKPFCKLFETIERMLVWDPEERITAREALEKTG